MPPIPPRSCRILLSFIVRPLLHLVVGKHGLAPMFGEKRICGLPRPGHLDISNTGTAWCHRLSVLLVPTPPNFLVTRVVISEPVPP